MWKHRSWSCIGLVAFAGAFLSRTPVARAFECETRTDRPIDEIVVPLGDSERDDQSIKIEQGESLCITGTLDSGGFLSELGVVSSARDVSGPIIELRLDNSRGTRLVIRHSGTNWLEYRAHTIATPQDLAFPTSTLPVGPGAGNVESWKGERKLLLHGFRFLEGRSEQEVLALTHEPRTRNTSVFNASVTFGLWGGERGVDFGTLNDVLGRDGFGSLPYTSVQGGLDLDFTFGRVRAGVTFGAGGRTVQHGSTGTELSIGLAEIGFTLGYDVVRYEQLHAFVSTGIIGSSLYVDLAPGLTAFPDVKPWEGERVEFSASSWPVEIGTDYFIPLGRASATEYFILQFGTRVGWIEQLGGGGWATDEGDDSRDLDGPPVDLSGWRGRLVLGIGAQNGW
jgi:hypothetical protein